MALFTWHTAVKNLPADWRATRGRAVKVGVIDSGAFFNHPVLQHQDKPGRKFDCRRPNPGGNDDVSDCRPLNKPHGTTCAAIIAGLSAAPGSAEGMATEVELHIFRAVSNTCDPTLELFLRALKAAADRDLDILSISVAPLPDQNIPQAEIDRAFQRLTEKNICLIASLRNTNSWNMLHRIPFPANRPETITAGVATPTLLESMPPGAGLSKNINLLAPQSAIFIHGEPDEGPAQEGLLRSSFATAALAGIAALVLANARNTAQNPTLRLGKTAMLQQLQLMASPFSKEAMMEEDGLRYFINPTAIEP